MVLQRSALHSVSEGSGAKFHERFGWELPAAYFDVLTEYQAATTGAALHDISYTGRLKATGADTLDLLNHRQLVMTLDAVRKAEEIWNGPFGRRRRQVAGEE